ncbi:hypothetical protein GH714_021077 [Hevea brasiliensis]|uniref:Uncharacterized protein n=1 Tax=Hevea brasiliensis TaxID=3981 RepID=A0A6A6M299_HEVBR|nr:hypothetical protein GH714_021077 [Hevea brasiliensis]
MVFRDALKQPKVKVEGAGGDSPVTVTLQNCVASQLPAYLEEDLGFSQKNLQSLASFLLSRNVNPKDIETAAWGYGTLDLFSLFLMPWEAFDPIRQRWMRLPRMPCDECFTYADKESLAVGTELLVFGRELSGFAIWMYSLLSHEWSRCPPMSLPRCLFGSSSLGEIAIIAGGSDKNGRILRSAELYNSELECLSCGEEYNLETRIWRRIENMYPVSSVGHPAMRSPPLVAVVNNQLYSADQATNEVKKYDKTNNSWSVVKQLPVRADSSHGWGLAFKACGSSLLVIGGHRGPEGEVIVLHSWDPQDRSMDGPEWNVLAVKERAGALYTIVR